MSAPAEDHPTTPGVDSLGPKMDTEMGRKNTKFHMASVEDDSSAGCDGAMHVAMDAAMGSAMTKGVKDIAADATSTVDHSVGGPVQVIQSDGTTACTVIQPVPNTDVNSETSATLDGQQEGYYTPSDDGENDGEDLPLVYSHSLQFHPTPDLLIHAKDENGELVAFYVNSSILAAASPVFKELIDKEHANHPEGHDGAEPLSINLWKEDGASLRFVLRVLHFQPLTQDVMRKRTYHEIFRIVKLACDYQLDSVIATFAAKWSKEYVADHAFIENLDAQGIANTLWMAWQFADLKTFTTMFQKMSMSLTVGVAANGLNGVLIDGAGKPLTEHCLNEDIRDWLAWNRQQAICKVLKPLGEAMSYIMSVSEHNINPDNRYCKSVDSKNECHATLLGSIITALVKAKMYPLPNVCEYRGSLSQLVEKVRNLHITPLIFPGRPPHEQRHTRCGLGHKAACDAVENEMPTLGYYILEWMYHNGRLMGTLDDETWAHYAGRAHPDEDGRLREIAEINLEPIVEDNGDPGWYQ